MLGDVILWVATTFLTVSLLAVITVETYSLLLYFGAALHVSGPERSALEQAIEGIGRDSAVWEEVEPSLEDVFITLMARSGGDQRDHG